MADSVRDHVAGVLRAEIARLRLTQREVASRCGRSQPWITERLAGRVPCTVDDLELLGQVLGVPVAHFMPAEQTASAR